MNGVYHVKESSALFDFFFLQVNVLEFFGAGLVVLEFAGELGAGGAEFFGFADEHAFDVEVGVVDVMVANILVR